MCGVVAALSLDGTPRPVDLRPALAAMKHRGPDGSGVWVDKTGAATLGHVRLAIVDPARGAQPLTSEDGAVAASVNGEFYGFEDQRADLRLHGHVFATGSDSEVLVHLYEEERGDAQATLGALRGEFAFALWDGRRRRLVAARDRFGIKPLVWTQHDGQLLVASEAKALFALGVTARWDARSFAHMVTHQYLPTDRTLFAGVRTVPPGHALIAEDGRVRLVRYWDLDYPMAGDVEPSEPDALQRRLFQALDDAVRVRLRADVPLGFYLSGGLDSASIVALAARHATRPRCFAVSFGHAPYDELDHARVVAEHVGADLEPVHVDQSALVDALPEAVRCAEGVGINGQFAAKFLLARAVHRAGIKVVLTGEGADEALLGYPHLVEDVLRDGTTDDALRWRDELHRDTQAYRGVMMPDADVKLPGVRDALGTVPTWFEAKALLGRRVCMLLTDDARHQLAGRDAWGDLLAGVDVAGQLEGRSPVVRSAYLWSRLAMTGYIVRTLGDGTEMASSIEGRPAFLDHRLFSCVRRLPVGVLVREGVEKWLLRKAMAPHLPASITARRKHPFLAPPITAFSTPGIEAFVRDTLAADLPFFDRGRIRALLDRLPAEARPEQVAAEPAVMIALCVALMHQQFSMEVG